jgi:hypothetical protein
MDKALAYGARDSRFDPWQDREELNRCMILNEVICFSGILKKNCLGKLIGVASLVRTCTIVNIVTIYFQNLYFI